MAELIFFSDVISSIQFGFTLLILWTPSPWLDNEFKYRQSIVQILDKTLQRSICFIIPQEFCVHLYDMFEIRSIFSL